MPAPAAAPPASMPASADARPPPQPATAARHPPTRLHAVAREGGHRHPHLGVADQPPLLLTTAPQPAHPLLCPLLRPLPACRPCGPCRPTHHPTAAHVATAGPPTTLVAAALGHCFTQQVPSARPLPLLAEPFIVGARYSTSPLD
jgi:hypothetical protein